MNPNKLMYILVGVIVVAVFVTFVVILRNVGSSGGQPVTLQFWGVFDNRSIFDKVIRDFKAQNPSIDIRYTMLTYEQYEQALINGLASGAGPDIFMMHNTWLPKHGSKLASMPEDIPNDDDPFTIQDFKAEFVDTAFQDLIYQGQIYGMPLYMDTLALFYNKDLFNIAGITRPPGTWDEVNEDVPLLTKFDDRGNIVQAGIALGTARNINRSTDILMDMMIQSGTEMTSSDNLSATFSAPINGQYVGEIALQYYTDFANSRNPLYSWNSIQHYSIDAFTEGSLGMMVGYSHQIPVIRAKAPRLNFAVAPMPQASLTDIRNFANYWAAAVSRTSAHPVEAWKFVNYLTSRDGASAYLNNSQRPAARRDLIDLQRSDPDLGIFAVQALTARSWFQADNVIIEGIFADMIDEVNFNRATIREAIQKAASRVTVLMQR